MIIACNCIHCVESKFDELFLNDGDRNTANKTKHIPPERNQLEEGLEEQRRLRKLLNDRLLQLCALVPNITNLDRAAIITGAITYIQELKQSVEQLNNQLMEPTSIHDNRIKIEQIDDEQVMKNLEITPEIEVSYVSETKLWIKAVFPKKRGASTKLMEAISILGFDLKETSITTSGGAVLFTTIAEGNRGGLAYTERSNKYLF